MPATQTRRDERISLRVTTEQKDLITRAAQLETSGDLTRFMTEAAMRAARHTMEEYGVTHLSEPVRRRFYDLLFNPPEPSEELISLMAADVPAGFTMDD
ncbi:MAG: type II toxin-antitoxin system TacA family antitoxin [Vulcanimicrobiaceae bacterium]